jgi:hypothetical protein
VGVFDELDALLRPARTASPPLLPAINGHAEHRSLSAYHEAALSDECTKVASAPGGQRNDTLNRAWFKLGRIPGMDVEVARGRLWDAGRTCGLPEHEIALVLRDDTTSGFANGAGAQRVIPDRPDRVDLSGVVLEFPGNGSNGPGAALAAPGGPGQPPVALEVAEEEFWGSRPLLAHLRTFAQARLVSPWALRPPRRWSACRPSWAPGRR